MESGGTPRGAEGLLDFPNVISLVQQTTYVDSLVDNLGCKCCKLIIFLMMLCSSRLHSLNIFSLVQQRTYVDTLVDSRIRSTQSQIMTCCRGAVLRRHMLLRAMLRIFCRSYPHVDQLCPSALRVSPASGVFVSCFFNETELQSLRHQSVFANRK